MPRPDPRKLPEMPRITPWVPHVPTMPDLPDEIPWPPDFDFEYDLSPWYSGNDGRPYCYNDFASRLMRLIVAVAAYRNSVGLRPMLPPFDLRFMVATPTLVNIATLWLAAMWNSCAVSVLDPTPRSAQFHMGLNARDAVIYHPTSSYYQSRSYNQGGTVYTALRVGNDYSCGWVFINCDIKSTDVITDAILFVSGRTNVASGTLDINIQGSTWQPYDTDFNSFNSVNAHVTAATTAKHRITGTYVDRATLSTAYDHSLAEVFREIIAQPWWSDSSVNKFGIIATKAGTCSQDWWPYARENGSNYASFWVYYQSRTLVLVPPIGPLTLTSLDCGPMNAWLGNAEAVIWPILRG